MSLINKVLARECRRIVITLYKIKRNMVHKEFDKDILNKAAARLGLLVAGMWTVSFVIVVTNFPSLFSELGYFIGLLSIWMIGKNLRNLKKYIMPISWAKGLSMCLLSFFGGTLIFTLVQYLYFAYVDHGHFLNIMLDNLKSPEMVETMKLSGNSLLLDQMIDIVTQMQEMTPRVLTLNFFSTNLILALVFSVFASLIGGFKPFYPTNKEKN